MQPLACRAWVVPMARLWSALTCLTVMNRPLVPVEVRLEDTNGSFQPPHAHQARTMSEFYSPTSSFASESPFGGSGVQLLMGHYEIP